VSSHQTESFLSLLHEVRACTICEAHLPCPPRPVVQLHPRAKILIAGQAPGRKVQASGIPFDDASGDRLRRWLGIDRATFYTPEHIAILPMGFCFPGTGTSGDRPPRPECAPAWRQVLLNQLTHLDLTLAIGNYAQAYHLGGTHRSVTERVKSWRDYWPTVMPLPHPSPRNNRWLRQNPWFEAELIPVLQARVSDILA
jgi:uracil-DNA glycosylase